MTQWPHAPSRVVTGTGFYMVTSGTVNKEHLFNSPVKLELLQTMLFDLMIESGWRLEAWAVFSNHYHFIANAKDDDTLRILTRKLHGSSAREINRLDGKAGRTVWYSYWQTKLTYEKSYLARLNYVHLNPVRHKLVEDPHDYPFCSARWFRDHADRAWYDTVSSFKVDRVSVVDDF